MQNQVLQDEVRPHVGHVLTKDGLNQTLKRPWAGQAMKHPQNTIAKELMTFFVFIQYLGNYPKMAKVSAPPRKLVEMKITWQWDQEQEASFQKLKEMS